MPQGANTSPSWFVKVINRVVHGLERVLAYLDDVICFDEDRMGHVLNMTEFFKRLRQYNLKLSPGNARVGATHANFLGHAISPAGVSPDGVEVRALTHMPPPTNVKQLWSLLGGLSYYRKSLEYLATKVRPLNSLLKQGVPFKYIPGMVKVVKTLLSELARPPILVFPDWASIEDNSRPLRLCSDACIDGFGASLEQEQLDGSVRPIVYITRAILAAERNWTVLDLDLVALFGPSNAFAAPLDKQDHPDRRASAATIRDAGIGVFVDCSCATLNSGGTVTGPAYFGRQPRATIVPRISSPARRSSRPRSTNKTTRTAARLLQPSATPASAFSSTAPAPPVSSPSAARPASPVSPSLQGPGTVVGVDFFGPLSMTAKGNSYIWLFTNRFSRRADMFAVSAAKLTAKGTAQIFVNQYMTKWGCPTTLLSDNRLHFCPKLSMAIYEVMKIKKVTTSSNHPQTNGGTERVNHTVAQMLAVVVNEQQNDWDLHLPHVEFA
ncbi:unnamed protein product [Ectocarpus sp. CCAP 1310/34]|nr:unnamed protein product [Ectocarpus sp. CCAP 1310/34]